MFLLGRLVARQRTTIVWRPLLTPIRVMMSGGLLALAALVAARADRPDVATVAVIALCCAAATALWNSCAFLCVSARDVRLGLSPLCFVGFAAEDVAAVRAISIRPLGREWGNRGRPRGPGGLLVDVGHSVKALRIDLRDGRSYSVGTGSAEPDVADLCHRLGLDTD